MTEARKSGKDTSVIEMKTASMKSDIEYLKTTKKKEDIQNVNKKIEDIKKELEAMVNSKKETKKTKEKK